MNEASPQSTNCPDNEVTGCTCSAGPTSGNTASGGGCCGGTPGRWRGLLSLVLIAAALVLVAAAVVKRHSAATADAASCCPAKAKCGSQQSSCNPADCAGTASSRPGTPDDTGAKRDGVD